MEKLSILIPIFNWDCRQLLTDLHSQALSIDIRFQIVAVDDASTNTMLKHQNSSTALSLEFCRYIELTERLDRAAMRNYMAEQADGDFLLFVDCDAGVISSEFLANYISAFDDALKFDGKEKVIVGGLTHSYLRPRPGMELRYYYEREADKHRSAEYRRQHPYDDFTAFSFLIGKKTFDSIRFDEGITEYGYEDVLFGAELQNKGIEIVHIDNPLVHMGIESSEIYLNKVEASLRQAYQLGNIVHKHSKVAIYCRKASEMHMCWAVKLVWKIFYKPIRKNLLGSNPNLKWFAFYKLGYFISLSSK